MTRLFAPATERNRDPILSVLRRILPPQGLVLELASGTGEHITYFAKNLPALRWQPSDPDPDHRLSVAAWAVERGVTSVQPPLALDVRATPWPLAHADAVLCINMVHISPWEATLALLRGARAVLSPGAPLFLYGPYRRAGHPTAPSNEAFDQSLRDRDPAWGLRKLEDVVAAARDASFHLDEVVEMPANNLSVVLRRAPDAPAG